MSAADWGAFAGRLIWELLVLTVRAAVLLVGLSARLTVAIVPTPTTSGAASRTAVLVGGAWVLGMGILAAFTANGTVIVIGLLLGACLGAMAGYAVLQHGLAYVSAASGSVQIGERAGSFGMVEPHLIARESRVRHVAVFGATGSGKSTVLKNIVLQDARAPGRPGILCIDIKDDFALSLIDLIPAERREDILLFDPSDREYPPAFNPLVDIALEESTLVTAELLAALKRLCGDSWGPRLEHVLRHVLLTLVETPQATLLDIARILTDEAYRTWALEHVTNFSVRLFWEQEYPSIVGKSNSLANVSSLLNKLSVFSYPEVRNVVGQASRGLDLSQAMADGNIVMAHLPQGVLGEDIAHFFAALLVGKIQLAAQRRVQLAHSERTPFYVFADEFQNYDTSAFTKLITEGRSMGVGMVVACQFREQLPSGLRLAVEKNCAYGLLCRRMDDRHVIEVIKLQEPTAPDASVLLSALPPPFGPVAEQRAAVRQQSRDALARPRHVVEAGIAHRLSQHRQPAAATAPPTATQRRATLLFVEETGTEPSPKDTPTPAAPPPIADEHPPGPDTTIVGPEEPI